MTTGCVINLHSTAQHARTCDRQAGVFMGALRTQAPPCITTTCHMHRSTLLNYAAVSSARAGLDMLPLALHTRTLGMLC